MSRSTEFILAQRTLPPELRATLRQSVFDLPRNRRFPRLFPSLSTTRALDRKRGDLSGGIHQRQPDIDLPVTESRDFETLFSYDRAGPGRFGRFNSPMRVVDKSAPNDRRERWRIRHPFCCGVLVGVVWNAPL